MNLQYWGVAAVWPSLRVYQKLGLSNVSGTANLSLQVTLASWEMLKSNTYILEPCYFSIFLWARNTALNYYATSLSQYVNTQ